MSNQLTALDFEMWEAETQALLEERSIFMDLATMRDAQGKKIIHNPYYVRGAVSTYTAGNDMTDNDIISVADDMDTFTTKYYTFVYDKTEALDTEYNVVMAQKEIAAYQLSMDMERAFFEEYANAANSSANTTLDSTNTLTTFATWGATLTNLGADDREIVTVVDPFTNVSIANYVTTNGFQVSDETIKRGYQGQFAGNPLYKSSSLIATTTLAIATEPTADDTVTINGVVFTFKASPAAAGEVKLTGTAATTVDNLVAAINGTGTGDGTDYFDISAETRESLIGIVATDNTTSIGLEMRGYRIVSSSLTAGADKFAAVISNCLVMARGAIDFALRSPVQLISEKIQKRLAWRYSAWCNYGKKTFAQNKKRMYVVKVVAQAAEA